MPSTKVAGPPRVFLNVPFDREFQPLFVSLIAGVVVLGGRHDFYVFEERSFRLQRSLSDLGGYDPQVHGGTQLGIARSLLNCMATSTRAPRPEQMTALARKLGVAARELASRSGARSIYEPHIFRQIAAGAAELAREARLID